jgi:protein phosphatase
MLQLETAGLSDIGKKRCNQEDAFLVDDEHRLYVVADGMGGHLAGEVASAIAVESLQAAAANDVPSLVGSQPDTSLSPEYAMLAAWIQDANSTVYQQSQDRKECRGMGTTLSTLYFADIRVVLANVGDSPVYLLRAGSIELISAMHTVADDPEIRDLYGPDPLLGQFNHMLTRAVGTADTVQPYLRELTCQAGDSFIICSDGLSNAVQPEEMISITLGKSAQKACRELIDLANARGGDDNTTVIVINVCEGVPKRK